MKTLKNSLLLLWLLSLISPGACFANAKETTGSIIFHQKQAEFRPWSSLDLNQAESLFKAFFSGTSPLQQRSAWQNLGMSVSIQTLANGKTAYLISPGNEARQGAGYYLLRPEGLATPGSESGSMPGSMPGPMPELMLQAPHQFHDRHTGHIATQIFTDHPVRALVLNSAHRKRVANRASLSTNPDLAHNPNTLLMSFTRGFIAAYPDGKVVQIHGFSASKRKTAAGRRAQIIVSGGANWPTALSTDVANCLSERQAEVYLYPRDINELGGTTNSIANWLSSIGKSQFIHLENSSKMRENILNNPIVRSLIWSCLSKDSAKVGDSDKPYPTNGRLIPGYDY